MKLRVPKLREESYFPCLLQPRRRVEQALVAVIQAASVHGVSTRTVGALVQALEMTGISKSQVSRLWAELDPRPRPSVTVAWRRRTPPVAGRDLRPRAGRRAGDLQGPGGGPRG